MLAGDFYNGPSTPTFSRTATTTATTLKRSIVHEKILHGLERYRSNLTKTITAHMNAENMNHDN